jgi:hypothetical protein
MILSASCVGLSKVDLEVLFHNLEEMGLFRVDEAVDALADSAGNGSGRV